MSPIVASADPYLPRDRAVKQAEPSEAARFNLARVDSDWLFRTFFQTGTDGLNVMARKVDSDKGDHQNCKSRRMKP